MLLIVFTFMFPQEIQEVLNWTKSWIKQ